MILLSNVAKASGNAADNMLFRVLFIADDDRTADSSIVPKRKGIFIHI